jgi:hypothetical protein
MLEAGLGGVDGPRIRRRLFRYLWLSLHTSNKHAGSVSQLIQEPERRGQVGMVERAPLRAETTPRSRLV